MPLETNYDVVVVGAGNGGLTAAATLALKGLKVLLLEQHNLPGGFATSFVRGRFEFEPSLHELAGVGPREDKQDVRRLFEDNLGIEINWVIVPEAYRLILTKDPEDSLDVTMPFGVNEYIDKMEEYVPGSRERITEYFTLCREVLEAIGYLGASKGKADKDVLMNKYPNFLKTCAYTVEDVAKSLKIPQKAQKILHAYWSYLGPDVSRANFTIFAAMLYKYITKGAYIPRYRSHEMSTALDEKIKLCGGSIEYNTRVKKILVEKGQIKGVETDQGDRIATKYVVSNASPHLVYNNLIYPKKEVPQKALQHCNFRDVGASAFVVYLGLDRSPEELGLNEYSYFIYQNMNTSYLYDGFKKLEPSRVQATTCLNNVIPDCSPEGTTIMSMTTLYKGEVWKDVRPQDYVKIKNELALSMIKDFEKALGISIKEHIEEIEVATPATFSRYTGSFNASVYGYEPTSTDSLIPRMMMMKEDSFINGLDFTGGCGFRCHGYSSSLLSGETIGLLTFKNFTEVK